MDKGDRHFKYVYHRLHAKPQFVGNKTPRAHYGWHLFPFIKKRQKAIKFLYPSIIKAGDRLTTGAEQVDQSTWMLQQPYCTIELASIFASL